MNDRSEGLTTADIAGQAGPEADGMDVAGQAGSADLDNAAANRQEGRDLTNGADGRDSYDGSGAEPLLGADESKKYSDEWHTVQSQFVDQPREAVADADRLVADLMQRLAAEFTETRTNLERQWDGQDDISTEELPGCDDAVPVVLRPPPLRLSISVSGGAAGAAPPEPRPAGAATGGGRVSPVFRWRVRSAGNRDRRPPTRAECGCRRRASGRWDRAVPGSRGRMHR